MEKFTKMSKTAITRSHERFIGCLYHCHKQFPAMAKPFCSKFMYSLKKESGVVLRQSLEMLSSCAPALLVDSPNGLNKELGMVGLSELLSHYDPECQLAAIELLQSVVTSAVTKGGDDTAALIANYVEQVLDKCSESPAQTIR